MKATSVASPTSTVNASSATLETAKTLIPLTSDIFKDVQVSLEIRLGQAQLSVAELLALRVGSTLQLETGLNDLAEVYLNGALVARGEIVTVSGRYAVRIIDVADAP